MMTNHLRRSMSISGILAIVLLLAGNACAAAQNETLSESNETTVHETSIAIAADTATPESTEPAPPPSMSKSMAIQMFGAACTSSCSTSAALAGQAGNAALLGGCVNACIVAASSVSSTTTVGDNYLDWPVGDSLFSYMSPRQFAHFNVLLLFGSVCIAGLGSEVVVGQFIVENFEPDTAAALWVYAQVRNRLILMDTLTMKILPCKGVKDRLRLS